MTREKARELLPILQAYSEGKPIQYWCDGSWCDGAHTFDANWTWRIKPEPRDFWIVRFTEGPWRVYDNLKMAESLAAPEGKLIYVREVL